MKGGGDSSFKVLYSSLSQISSVHNCLSHFIQADDSSFISSDLQFSKDLRDDEVI